MTEIETAQLLLRPWQPDDLAEFTRPLTDPEVLRYIVVHTPFSPQDVAEMSAPVALTGPVKMWWSLIMGLVLPAGLTRTGPDYVSLPGLVGRSGKATWCTRPDGLV